MEREVHTISSTATLTDVMHEMLHRRTNTLVVVDGKKTVVGIVSILDVISEIVPDYLEKDQHLGPFEAGELFEQRVQELSHEPIASFMTSTVHTIEEHHTLIEAASRLAEHRIHQLPVVDVHGKLVGFIGRSDVKDAIAHILHL